MAKKKEKMKTPDWIIEGYDSPAEYNKAKGIKSEKKGRSSAYPKAQNSGAKTFKIRECPKCHSDDVGLILSNSDAEQGGGKEWECRKCKWKGRDINEKELTEDELMAYMDSKGEEVA